jgi:hypothetical protein
MSAPRDVPEPGGEEQGRSNHAHIVGMILCCIPMVVAIVWLLAAAR